MVKVKICGITRVEDALAAVEAGVDALGFIFVAGSPRYVTLASARDIITRLPPFVTPVGVFANAPRDLIVASIAESGIRCLQFHGAEAAADMMGYPVPGYKAFRVGPSFEVWAIKAFPGSVCLLDTFSEGTLGGTGKSFNWNIALEAQKLRPVILSGGITASNVSLAVKKVRPYAIDVSSGVESSPGIKDVGKIQRLLAALKTAWLNERAVSNGFPEGRI